jgi:hypothetical protein
VTSLQALLTRLDSMVLSYLKVGSWLKSWSLPNVRYSEASSATFTIVSTQYRFKAAVMERFIMIMVFLSLTMEVTYLLELCLKQPFDSLLSRPVFSFLNSNHILQAFSALWSLFTWYKMSKINQECITKPNTMPRFYLTYAIVIISKTKRNYLNPSFWHSCSSALWSGSYSILSKLNKRRVL